MITIAITGSIGMGKTRVAAMFRARGIPVFDADSTVRQLQSKGGALVADIARRFPGSVVDGAVDRERLSAMVLGNREELDALEAIVHPAVQAAREKFLREHHDAPAVVFEIPLLFETEGESAFDKVVVVSAGEEVQRQRVMARSGMTAEKLTAILARQMPDSLKRTRADFVIDTGGSLMETERQVDDVLACLGLLQGR